MYGKSTEVMRRINRYKVWKEVMIINQSDIRYGYIATQ